MFALIGDFARGIGNFFETLLSTEGFLGIIDGLWSGLKSMF